MRYWEDEPSAYSTRRWNTRSVVSTLIIVNVVIFLLEFVVNAARRYADFFGPFELSANALLQHGRIWQLVTYAFLHDPAGIMHIVFNMLFLWWFGREIEETWGSRRFLWFYLGAAAFAGLCFVGLQEILAAASKQALEAGVDPRYTPVIGASGAIFALVMVYGLYWPNRTILFMLIFPMRIKTFVLIVIGIETLNVVSVKSGVANIAHLGGLLFGYLVVKFGPYVGDYLARRPQRSGRRWEPTADDQRRLDEILDKVGREGVQSLGWRERRFLRKFRRE